MNYPIIIVVVIVALTIPGIVYGAYPHPGEVSCSYFIDENVITCPSFSAKNMTLVQFDDLVKKNHTTAPEPGDPNYTTPPYDEDDLAEDAEDGPDQPYCSEGKGYNGAPDSECEIDNDNEDTDYKPSVMPYGQIYDPETGELGPKERLFSDDEIEPYYDEEEDNDDDQEQEEESTNGGE